LRESCQGVHEEKAYLVGRVAYEKKFAREVKSDLSKKCKN